MIVGWNAHMQWCTAGFCNIHHCRDEKQCDVSSDGVFFTFFHVSSGSVSVENNGSAVVPIYRPESLTELSVPLLLHHHKDACFFVELGLGEPWREV